MECWKTVRTRRPSKRAGFGLVEVMAATAVLVVSLMAAVGGQLAALRLMRTTRENSTATSELTAAMEEVSAKGIDGLPIAGSPYADGQPIATFTDRALHNERVVATYPGYAAGSVPNPLTIVLRLTWTDWAGRPAQMRVATMKAR